MATILNTQSNLPVLLYAYHTFGRHPDGNCTILPSPDVSRHHAVIFWDGEHWQLKCNGSNGTYVNGGRIPSGVPVPLNKNDRINFGNLQCDTWRLAGLEAPECMLFPVTRGLPAIVLSGVIALPSEDSPKVTLYLSSEGVWTCESESGTGPLLPGDLVGTHDKIWRFVKAEPSINTRQHQDFMATVEADLQLHFKVSQNEEHVSLQIHAAGQTMDLGERSHHYLLLILARKRLEDQAIAVNETEQGWLDKDMLQQLTGLSETHVNILIYRFRKQYVTAFPPAMSPPQIIERRPGELRIACGTIRIEGSLTQHLTPVKA